MNQVMLVGRLSKEPYKELIENGKEETRIELAVNRSYKNVEGIYETDLIECALWSGLSEQMNNYCHKGDVIGVRGRLETRPFKRQIVIVEKLTFLSSARENDN